jgi:hypothetical protein
MLAKLQSGVQQIFKKLGTQIKNNKTKKIVYSYNYIPLYFKVGGRVCFKIK